VAVVVVAADVGQIAVGLFVAAAGFIIVVLVCAGLLAIFQRVLPSAEDADGASEPQETLTDSEPGAS